MKRTSPQYLVSCLLLLLVSTSCLAQEGALRLRDKQREANWRLPAEVASSAPISVILGRPSNQSVTASLLSAQSGEAYIEFGMHPGRYERQSESVHLNADQPRHLVLDKLASDRRVYYRLRFRASGGSAFDIGDEDHFHTQRASGSNFVFEVQGDSHPERRRQFDPELYARTLRGVAADHPDFYILMGDDFSVDTLANINAQTVEARYRMQRPFLSVVGRGSPLFLVNGNHEQAALANLDGTPDNVAVWAQNARDAFFPQPAPDGFYTGNAEKVPFIGSLRDYYAWTWGDALFVVIDPYWHSPLPVDNVFGGGPKNRDLWSITLGEAQYRWLQKTLESSRARYKFVFTHHVLGTGRGGVELAGLYEWGGLNRKGMDEFRQRRPGWETPIHALMVKHGVTIFFQGHDHLFARQELDGVIYQTLPEPADPNYAQNFPEAYRSGNVLPNSGRLRIAVTPKKVRVEYVRSLLPRAQSQGNNDGEVAFAYEVGK